MTVQSELRAIAERHKETLPKKPIPPEDIKLYEFLEDKLRPQSEKDRARLLELVPEWLEAGAEDCRQKARSNHTNHQTTDETIFYVIAENCVRLAREWREMVGGK